MCIYHAYVYSHKPMFVWVFFRKKKHSAVLGAEQLDEHFHGLSFWIEKAARFANTYTQTHIYSYTYILDVYVIHKAEEVDKENPHTPQQSKVFPQEQDEDEVEDEEDGEAAKAVKDCVPLFFAGLIISAITNFFLC